MNKREKLVKKRAMQAHGYAMTAKDVVGAVILALLVFTTFYSILALLNNFARGLR